MKTNIHRNSILMLLSNLLGTLLINILTLSLRDLSIILRFLLRATTGTISRTNLMFTRYLVRHSVDHHRTYISLTRGIIQTRRTTRQDYAGTSHEHMSLNRLRTNLSMYHNSILLGLLLNMTLTFIRLRLAIFSLIFHDIGTLCHYVIFDRGVLHLSNHLTNRGHHDCTTSNDTHSRSNQTHLLRLVTMLKYHTNRDNRSLIFFSTFRRLRGCRSFLSIRQCKLQRGRARTTQGPLSMYLVRRVPTMIMIYQFIKGTRRIPRITRNRLLMITRNIMRLIRGVVRVTATFRIRILRAPTRQQIQVPQPSILATQVVTIVAIPLKYETKVSAQAPTKTIFTPRYGTSHQIRSTPRTIFSR